jgi:hypothetical protein
VIRYDHRDTGRSVTYPPEAPEYTGSDLDDDALGVLDASVLRRRTSSVSRWEVASASPSPSATRSGSHRSR